MRENEKSETSADPRSVLVITRLFPMTTILDRSNSIISKKIVEPLFRTFFQTRFSKSSGTWLVSQFTIDPFFSPTLIPECPTQPGGIFDFRNYSGPKNIPSIHFLLILLSKTNEESETIVFRTVEPRMATI